MYVNTIKGEPSCALKALKFDHYKTLLQMNASKVEFYFALKV